MWQKARVIKGPRKGYYLWVKGKPELVTTLGIESRKISTDFCFKSNVLNPDGLTDNQTLWILHEDIELLPIVEEDEKKIELVPYISGDIGKEIK